MGRTRKRDRHLPKRVYLVHGSYWFRPKGGKGVNLGPDLGAAIVKYGQLIGTEWHGRTLGDVIDRYRTEVLPLKRSASTRRDQAKQLDKLKIAFGSMLPDLVTTQICYRFQDGRRGEDGQPIPTTARHEISLLGHVYGKAIRWGVATTNPVRAMEKGQRGKQRDQVTMAQVEAFKAGCGNERIRIAVDLAIWIGQRRGDLLKLRWADITAEGVFVQQGKTGAKVLIERSADLDDILKRAKGLKPDLPREFVLRNRTGRPYSKDGFSAIWQRYQKAWGEQGNKRFSFHDLRSVSADEADTVEEARDRLGHASAETTRRHYRRGVTKAKPRS